MVTPQGTRFMGDALTVTVLASSCVQRPDGSTALLLETKEAGPIAFVVDERAVRILRRDLDEAALALSQKPGNA